MMKGAGLENVSEVVTLPLASMPLRDDGSEGDEELDAEEPLPSFSRERPAGGSATAILCSSMRFATWSSVAGIWVS